MTHRASICCSTDWATKPLWLSRRGSNPWSHPWQGSELTTFPLDQCLFKYFIIILNFFCIINLLMKKSVKQNYQRLLNKYCQTTHSFNSSKMRCNDNWFKDKRSFTCWINTLKQQPQQDPAWYSCFDSAIANYPLETITVNHLNQFILGPLKQHPHLKSLNLKKLLALIWLSDVYLYLLISIIIKPVLNLVLKIPCYEFLLFKTARYEKINLRLSLKCVCYRLY